MTKTKKDLIKEHEVMTLNVCEKCDTRFSKEEPRKET